MPRRNYLQLRFSDSEIASYQVLANKANLPLAEWVRGILNDTVRLNNVRVEFDRRYAEAKEKGKEFARKLQQRRDERMNYQLNLKPLAAKYLEDRQSVGSSIQLESAIDYGADDIAFVSSGSYRELSSAELPCPVRGCSLGSNHLGPCVPKYAESETQEIIEQNLLILSRNDPEEFRNRIRELLRTKGDSK